MIGFTFYILQVALTLAILFGVYWLLLRRDSSFTFNRFFLLSAIVVAFVLPVLEFSSGPVNPIAEPIQTISQVRTDYMLALESWYEEGSSSNTETNVMVDRPAVSVVEILFGIYLIVFAALLFRLGIMVFHFAKLVIKHKVSRIEDKRVVVLPYEISPFSFADRIFISESLLEDHDALSKILAHEYVHIKQGHSIDLLIVQLTACVLWFNPVVWWLSKSIKETHEYIADEEVIKMGYPLEVYQSLLLRQLISNQSIGLVHNFNLSFIKKRITMMNIKKSKKRGVARTLAALMLSLTFSALFTQCNVEGGDELASLSGSSELPLVVPSINSKTTFDKVVTIEMGSTGFKVDNVSLELSELESYLTDQSIDHHAVMQLRISGKIKMDEVEELFGILQNIDRRKVLSMGLSSEGDEVGIRMLLPPSGDAAPQVITPEQARSELGLTIFEVDFSKEQKSLDKEVRQFLEGQLEAENSDYVVISNYDKETTYGQYLLGLSLINKGFNDLYDARSQKMFGKSWSDVNPEEYQDVRSGLPRAIMQNYKQ